MGLSDISRVVLLLVLLLRAAHVVHYAVLYRACLDDCGSSSGRDGAFGDGRGFVRLAFGRSRLGRGRHFGRYEWLDRCICLQPLPRRRSSSSRRRKWRSARFWQRDFVSEMGSSCLLA